MSADKWPLEITIEITPPSIRLGGSADEACAFLSTVCHFINTHYTPMMKTKKMSSSFFQKTSYDLAKDLLGKVLVRNCNGIHLKCLIVETELYPGGEDKASTSYRDRKTSANEPVFGPPGTTWVYLVYGIHHCINISSGDHGGAVLIRAGEPIQEIKKIRDLRLAKLRSKKCLKTTDLCSGPGRLCAGLDITKESCNNINVAHSDQLWIEDPEETTQIQKPKIVHCTRIGINRAGDEAVSKLWRFYIWGSAHVSKT